MIRNKSRRHLEPPRLNLTAMVDVFTVLLVFLLKSYSAEGTLNSPVPVNLPISTANLSGDLNLVVTVTEKELFLDQTKIVDSSLFSTDVPNIPKLDEAVVSLMHKNNTPSSQKQVTIQGDKRIPYYLLRKIIYTFTQNGFTDISLAVYPKESGK
ncbi:MAG: biopolymer transporter ExbD [Nitrospirae bacterium]|nr:biopolymer transporter ExbD [Nitrospirota bacterium]MBI3595470.1 biopolymer transporter ExbD [Nitrospirota bacterium]